MQICKLRFQIEKPYFFDKFLPFNPSDFSENYISDSTFGGGRIHVKKYNLWSSVMLSVFAKKKSRI